MVQPSQQTGITGTFSSQPAPQTNPFSADLREEFTSNFGTNTNAVSQIFKEGGFVSQNRNKYILVGVLGVLLLGGLLFYVFSGSDEGSDGKVDEELLGNDDSAKQSEESATEDSAATESKEEAKPAEEAAAQTEQAKGQQAAGEGGTGALSLQTPTEGARETYNELSGPFMFTWSGSPGATIIFSRNANMSPEIRRVKVSGSSYAFAHPYPGKWYWKVENASGASEVRSFTVDPPARRNVTLQQPASGGSIQGNGGAVSWQGDSYVAFYRVELSNSGWANPQYRFATAGTTVNLQGVTAGQYQLRVGAFSEVSGRWEYTQPVAVTVQ